MTGESSLGLDLYFTAENLKAGLLVSLLSVWVLVGVFYYLNRYTRRGYFSIWTVAWLFYALWLTLSLNWETGIGEGSILMLKQWCLSVSATFLLWGSLRFLGHRVQQILLGLFLCFLLVWSYIGAFFLTHPLQIQLPIFGLIGAASIFTGCGFYQYRLKREYLAAGLLSFGFSCWGIYLVAYPFLQTAQDLASTGFFIAAVLQLFIAVSMIILVLEQLRFTNQRKALQEIQLQKREKSILRTKVKSTEQRYRHLFEQANESIIIVAADNLRILELNDSAEHMLGVGKEEATQNALTAFFQIPGTPRPAPSTGIAWFELICQQRPLQVVQKDGTIVPTEVKGSAIDYDGTTAYQFFFREVTERSQLEEQLRHAERQSAVGQMVSGVAHEWKNALTAIKSFIDLVLADNSVSSQCRSDLEVASQECSRISRLVQNFLSLARERSEGHTMIDLNSLVRDVVELRKFEVSMAGVEQTLDLDPALPPTTANRDQIQQVILNLLNNALHSISTRSEGRRLRISTAREQDSLALRVEDNGAGVPAHLRSKIFEPYFTTKPVGLGTGLGLSISHSILCEHRGRLYCEASPLGGAAFVMELPLVKAAQLASAGEANTRDAG